MRLEKFNNISTEANWSLFFQQVDLYQNDKPVLVKNFLPHPEKYLSWKDVQISLDGYYSHWEIIKNGIKQNIPKIPSRWHNEFYDKKFLSDSINNNDIFTILNYSIHNEYTRALCKEIEELFPVVAEIHVYGSKGNTSSSFPQHYDMPSNFIIQAYGECKWEVYSNSISNLLEASNYTPSDLTQFTPLIQTTLKPGDMIYIPSRTYHAAFPDQPRLSISIPCHSSISTGADGRVDKNYFKI